MTDDLHSPVATALAERGRDAHPDLDELVRVSTARGGRLRRRRRAATALGTAAGLAAVSTCAVLLSGSDDGPTGVTEIATQPTSAPHSPSPASEPITLAELQQRLDALADQARDSDASAPVSVTAAGWHCDAPADEKLGCAKGAAVVTVSWRPVDERPAYLDPGKADVTPGVHTFVSEAHGRWFATVTPGDGATQADVDAVGAGLEWHPADR